MWLARAHAGEPALWSSAVGVALGRVPGSRPSTGGVAAPRAAGPTVAENAARAASMPY